MPDLSNNTVFFEADASNVSGTDPSWPENMLPSKVNDSARALQGAGKRFYDHVNATVVSGGTANVQTIAYAVAPTAYVTGDCYAFIIGPGLTNTGATTVNVNGLGARAVVIGADALAGGEMQAGQVAVVYCDAASLQLLRPRKPASSSATPINPTATSSATPVMMGLAGTITPTVSGNVVIMIAGNGLVDTGGNTFSAQIRYGTGSAPANGAAATGTPAGSNVQGQSINANAQVPFYCIAKPVSLVLGTAHWLDLGVSVAAAGAASVQNISIVAYEVPR